MDKLDRRLSTGAPAKRGSSMAGDSGYLGEVEYKEAESETSDGAPSAESARDTSDVAEGERRGGSTARFGGEMMVVRVAALWYVADGRAKVMASERSSNRGAGLVESARR